MPRQFYSNCRLLTIPFFLFLLLITFGIVGSREIFAASIESVKSGNWNTNSTWSTNTVPSSSDSVTIRSSHAVIYDASLSRISGLTVQNNAILEFAPNKSATLETDKNIVVYGVFKTHPSSFNVTHTIKFVNINELNFVGGGMDLLDSDIGLWGLEEGILNIAGTPKTAWTHLEGAAIKGENKITLSSLPTGWQVGDEVVIVPTEHPNVGAASWTGFDKRTISNISQKAITLSSGLTYNHPAAPDPFSTKVYTAEVLNLTRNVKIIGTGDGTADPTKNGRAHIFMRSSKPQSLKYLETQHLGPRMFNPQKAGDTELVSGRYPIHFHHSMNGSRGSIVEGVTVHQSGNRAFVPHASHGITFLNTIAYDIFEEAYWWDLPPENKTDPVQNVMNNSNDTVYDRAVAARLKTDPARYGNISGFLLGAGSGNAVRNSVAVGVEGSVDAAGYQWPSKANQNSGGNVWEFNQGNIAHNNNTHGIFTWQNDFHTHEIENTVLYRNANSAVDHGAYTNTYQYINITAFDSPTGLQEHSGASNNTDLGRADGYTLNFDKYRSNGTLTFPIHVGVYELPVLFKDCIFSDISLRDSIPNRGNGNPTIADFVNCTKPDGSNFVPTDFNLQNAKSGMRIRVQNRDNTAYSLDHMGNISVISTFYENQDFMIGDVNKDGTHNISDIIELIKMIFTQAAPTSESDIVKDNLLNLLDIFGLIKLV